jgi:hypothetical protein
MSGTDHLRSLDIVNAKMGQERTVETPAVFLRTRVRDPIPVAFLRKCGGSAARGPDETVPSMTDLRDRREKTMDNIEGG